MTEMNVASSTSGFTSGPPGVAAPPEPAIASTVVPPKVSSSRSWLTGLVPADSTKSLASCPATRTYFVAGPSCVLRAFSQAAGLYTVRSRPDPPGVRAIAHVDAAAVDLCARQVGNVGPWNVNPPAVNSRPNQYGV